MRAFPGPKIEVHITNVHARDSIYHNSQVSKVVTAVIAGLGFDGCEYALEAVRRRLDEQAGQALITSGGVRIQGEMRRGLGARVTTVC